MRRTPNLPQPTLLPLALVLALGLAAGSTTGAEGSPPSATSPESVEEKREPIPAAAIELRDQGLAELENEKPGEALKTFRRLTEMVPDDPLGWANLAIAGLREGLNTQAVATIERALKLAPERSDLLHIRGDILQWTGRSELALASYREAVERDPENVEALYSMYRQATQLDGEPALAATAWALERLIELRPENLVLLLHHGRAAIDADDREAASTTFLRIAELSWQGPEIAVTASDKLLQALTGPDPAAARVPAARLENVLKITPMYQQGLRELNTGIQGLPVWRFESEPLPSTFGSSLELTWTSTRLTKSPAKGLASADFDGDDRPDLAVLAGEPLRVEVLTAASDWQHGPTVGDPTATGTATGITTSDIDNDGVWDLIALGDGLASYRGLGDGTFEAAPFLPAQAGGTRVAAFDYDIEGDLDLAIAGPGPLQLWRNLLTGPLESVGAKSLPPELDDFVDLAVGDYDRDGDLDLAGATSDAVYFLENLRQGEFAAFRSPAPLSRIDRLASGDLDGDGRPELVIAGAGIAIAGWTDSGFSSEPPIAEATGTFHAVELLDADNDGRLDIAASGAFGTILLQQRDRGRYVASSLSSHPGLALVARDLDGDGDLDLIVAGPHGIERLDNVGGNANGWLALQLTGLVKGNSKNNVFGIGSLVELRAAGAYQFYEAQDEVTHIGLGDRSAADLRVVWTNGVPQNRLRVAGRQSTVEEQLLKGSCPFLYTWNGEEFAFVTDLLWGSPIGLPVAEGIFAGADPGELVEVVGAAPHDGAYLLQITEELWEAAFFDQVRLWVVDHPEEVEVASNLKVLPGATFPERVLGSRAIQPVAAAWDARGRDVTERVATRDDVYADGYEPSRYQGRSEASWSTTFDLGRSPKGPIRLHLDGWIFPSDASLNLAMDQAEFPTVLPRLEVETDQGWEVLMPAMGFPAGKTKTLIVDTPPLPAGSRSLRIVTSLWLGWDRIAWTEQPDDDGFVIQARLDPTEADLHYRGFSRLSRRAPNAPHHYTYSKLQSRSPWLPFPGHYTRFGEVTELLTASDDRSVVLAAGDEMTVRFDATSLPPVRPGWTRTLFLESQGWDKDADRNTGEGRQVEPLPFRAMTRYPFADGETFPNTPLLNTYRKEWLTRRVD